MRHRRFSGFTLVELLVVIAIIGVLVALLLPAVQAAREAARRSHCQNNLKQLGLALQNYHSSHKKFPPAGTDYGWCQHPEDGGAEIIRNDNGLRMLLPYLEQQVIYEQFDNSSAASDAMLGNERCCAPTAAEGTLLGDPVASGNAKLAENRLSIFLCPSDIGEVYLPDGGAKTNYDFNASKNIRCDDWSKDTTARRRMFGENSRTRAAMVTDGLSNTVALAETLLDLSNGDTTAWGFRTWVMVGLDIGTLEINEWETAAEPRRSQLTRWGAAGSLHGDAVHFVMADGSVHYVLDSTDQQVLEYLAGMSDDQIASLP